LSLVMSRVRSWRNNFRTLQLFNKIEKFKINKKHILREKINTKTLINLRL